MFSVKQMMGIGIIAVSVIALAGCSSKPAVQDGSVVEGSVLLAGSPLLNSSDSLDSNWVKEGVDDVQKRRDIETCYAIVKAQADHDHRITGDIDSSSLDSDPIYDAQRFTSELRSYSNQARLSARFEDCMFAKGYASGSQ